MTTPPSCPICHTPIFSGLEWKHARCNLRLAEGIRARFPGCAAPMDYVLTLHALRRMAERGIPRRAVEAALTHGRGRWSEGKILVRLPGGVLKSQPSLLPWRRLEVVVEPPNRVVTVQWSVVRPDYQAEPRSNLADRLMARRPGMASTC